MQGEKMLVRPLLALGLAIGLSGSTLSHQGGHRDEDLPRIANPAQRERGDQRTTHYVAQCLDDADQPVCLLRIVQWRPLPPLRTDWEFVNAPDIAAAVDREDQRPRPSLGLGGPLDKYYIERERAQAAEFEALAADRDGVAPRRALAPIRALDARRACAYAAIWRAYERASERPARGARAAPKPSRAFVRAALVGWEKELAKNGGLDFEFHRLARAYETLGDREGLRRVLDMDREAPGMRLELALAGGRLDEAAELLPLSLGHREFVAYASRTMEAARRAGRNDLAAEAAHLMVAGEDFLNSWSDEIPRAMEVFARHGRRADVLARLATFDALARGEPSYDSAAAAIVAAAGWTVLGMQERANQLLAIWAPRSAGPLPNRVRSCDPTRCWGRVVVQMLRRMNRLAEGFDGYDLTASDAVVFDLQDGRGLARLEFWLSRARSAEDREGAFSGCVGWSEEARALEISLYCARRLTEIGASRSVTAEEAAWNSADHHLPIRIPRGGPYVAATRSLQVAAQAAEAGDFAVMQEMLDAALSIWRDAPNMEWNIQHDLWIWQTAMGQLRAASRI